jgi:hypothetical protein
MTRHLTAGLAVAFIAAVVLGDLVGGADLNPYRAPPALALGSGQASAGGHCAALPGN